VQPNGTGAGILFNLNGAYNITGMHVYNYQELYSGQWYNGRSVQTAEIFYSTAPDGSGMIDAGQVTIPEAPDGNSPGGAAYAGSDVQLTAPLMGATFIQLGFETNYGDSQIIGINEVRFEANTAVPEPATLSLLLLGGLAALRRRK
jgi:hypothetical protein